MQYIYISIEEMKAVADYICQKGRVAISELAAKSNAFIDLEAKAVGSPAPLNDHDIFGDDDNSQATL